MSEKNIPVFANGDGEHQIQVGWAGEEVDGGRPIELDEEYLHATLTNVWFGEPDPNPAVTAEENAKAQAEAEESVDADASDAEYHDQPDAQDSEPIPEPSTAPSSRKKK